MATETVEVLIEGGKATAAPPLGPALGPLGVNIGQIVADINKKTQDFKGMQVPVKVKVDKSTKDYSISVGTPPASQLLIKEAGVSKGSGIPNSDYVADMKVEQIIKVSKMKEDALLGKDPIERVREIAGTAQSMGIKIEGMTVPEFLKVLKSGKYDDKILSGKTELSQKELADLETHNKEMAKAAKEHEDAIEAEHEAQEKAKEEKKKPAEGAAPAAEPKPKKE